MTADPNSPAENREHASQRHHAEECPDPATFAHQLFEYLADVHGDTDADLYLAKVIAELLELSPGAREHISDFLIVDLCEELHRRNQQSAARAVSEIQRDWMRGA